MTRKSIDSHRTTLRRLELNDFEKMRLLETDPLVMMFTPSRILQSEEQTRKRLENQIAQKTILEPFGIWVAELKKDSSFVGWFVNLPNTILAIIS